MCLSACGGESPVASTGADRFVLQPNDRVGMAIHEPIAQLA
jgi:hypothetical protein